MFNRREPKSVPAIADRPQTRRFPVSAVLTAAFALCSGFAVPASAGLSLTPVVLDFAPGEPPRADIDLLNNGNERLFVVVQPSRIEAAGTAAERRVQEADPQQLGLLATPPQLILEPGQRKYLRIVLLTPADSRDRVYRVTVKPVTGGVEAAQTGLKVLVGYDVLVIQRPQIPEAADRCSSLWNFANSYKQRQHKRRTIQRAAVRNTTALHHVTQPSPVCRRHVDHPCCDDAD